MPETIMKTICNHCKQEFCEDELTEFDESMLCDQCIRDETTVCNCCSERIWHGDDRGSNSISLCSYCRDTYYYNCTNCDLLLHSDDVSFENDTPYCSECYHDCVEGDEDLEYIESYNYKPSPIFHGDGIFYGLELELDRGGMIDNNAYELMCIGNNNSEHIYIKQDGSLDDGMEIVSHPMSLDYHLHSMPWEQILQRAVRMGYKSHQAGTCGMHCHVGRNALGENFEEQENTISNVLFFIEANWIQMLKFSRRTEEQMNRWASRYGYKDNPKELLEHAKNNTIGRYACVNLSNFATIEFRMFRGTLKLQTFIATLQMVDEICNAAISLSNDEMKNLSWQEFVLGINKDCKHELIEYLKLRRLYVNEPITEENEEI